MDGLRSTLQTAGIFHTEFALLVKVHRITVQRWLAGFPIRQSMTQDAVSKITDLLTKAVKLKLLPIKSDIPQKERMPAIRRALRSAHQSN